MLNVRTLIFFIVFLVVTAALSEPATAQATVCTSLFAPSKGQSIQVVPTTALLEKNLKQLQKEAAFLIDRGGAPTELLQKVKVFEDQLITWLKHQEISVRKVGAERLQILPVGDNPFGHLAKVLTQKGFFVGIDLGEWIYKTPIGVYERIVGLDPITVFSHRLSPEMIPVVHRIGHYKEALVGNATSKLLMTSLRGGLQPSYMKESDALTPVTLVEVVSRARLIALTLNETKRRDFDSKVHDSLINESLYVLAHLQRLDENLVAVSEALYNRTLRIQLFPGKTFVGKGDRPNVVKAKLDRFQNDPLASFTLDFFIGDAQYRKFVRHEQSARSFVDHALRQLDHFAEKLIPLATKISEQIELMDYRSARATLEEFETTVRTTADIH